MLFIKGSGAASLARSCQGRNLLALSGDLSGLTLTLLVWGPGLPPGLASLRTTPPNLTGAPAQYPQVTVAMSTRNRLFHLSRPHWEELSWQAAWEAWYCVHREGLRPTGTNGQVRS